MKLTPKDIRDRIKMTIGCASPEVLRTIPKKIRGYVEMMKEMLLDCADCSKSHPGDLAQCQSCRETQEVMGWALEKIRDIERLP